MGEHRLPVQRPPPAPQPVHQPPPVVEPFVGIAIETATPPARTPDAIKPNIDHSGHIRLLAKGDAEAAKLSIEALATSRQRTTILYGAASEVSGYMTGESVLDVMTITKNGETVAAYPVFKAGKARPARVTRVAECENGLEGQIEIFAGGGTLNFFDTMYFRHKGRYAPGSDVNVLLAGLAYVVARSPKGPADDIIARYEDGDVDDYVFRGTALDVSEITARGRKAWAVRTTLRPGHEGEPQEFYVCVTPSAVQEKLNPGDRISGIIWLQGFVLP